MAHRLTCSAAEPRARAKARAGKEGERRSKRPALHAAVLGFTHPRTGVRLRFEAPLPPDLAALLAKLEEREPSG